MTQNKVINDDDSTSFLDCVDENLSEVEYNESDNESGHSQESDCKSIVSNSEQSYRQAAPVVSGWHI
jgi:hypothetical protein